MLQKVAIWLYEFIFQLLGLYLSTSRPFSKNQGQNLAIRFGKKWLGQNFVKKWLSLSSEHKK
jgi:hypothetical protein